MKSKMQKKTTGRWKENGNAARFEHIKAVFAEGLYVGWRLNAKKSGFHMGFKKRPLWIWKSHKLDPFSFKCFGGDTFHPSHNLLPALAIAWRLGFVFWHKCYQYYVQMWCQYEDNKWKCWNLNKMPLKPHTCFWEIRTYWEKARWTLCLLMDGTNQARNQYQAAFFRSRRGENTFFEFLMRL